VFVDALLRLGGLDVLLTVLVGVALLPVLERGHWRSFALLMVVRAGLAVVNSANELAPIRRWQRHLDPDPATLAQVERAADRLWGQLTRVNGGLWLTALVGWAVFARFGVLADEQIGQVELLAVLAIMLMVVVALAALQRPLIDDLLVELRGLLARARMQAQLPPAARTVSIGRQLMAVAYGTFVSVLVASNTLVVLTWGKAQRSESTSELREHVGRLANELRTGVLDADALEPGVELRTSEQLPAVLVRDDVLARNGVLSGYELADEVAVAAAQVDGERWVVATRAVELRLAYLIALLTLLGTFALLPIVLSTASFRRILVDPLHRLDLVTRRLAEQGELGSLERIVPPRNDELGALIGNFNRMLDVFDQLAHAAASVAKGDLRVDISGSGDLPDALRGMLARLNEVVEQIRATSLELASAAMEIHAITREQEAAAEQQSQRVLDVSDTIATLAQAAEDISDNAGGVLRNAEQALATTDVMVERIAKLNTQTAGVRELLELIREVADRSDLLALNGALEATRAGEAGRGFALVASEMRRLAERVTGTLSDARDRLADIEAAGTSTVQATDASRRLASETATAARTISTVTAQQSAETEQVSIKVFEVAEVMIATVEATRQTLSAVEGLRQQAIELERLTAQFQLRETPNAEVGHK
jgi:methyl-accepting chemotaxis protein